MQEIELRLFS